MAGNIYFELTRAFNAAGPIAVLASGQAVVYYRVAIMSKDGDWVIRETAEACAQVLTVLAERGAVYRAGAPLDPRWLAGGWSSHFEFFDDKRRRVRCDFFSRPPRVDPASLSRLYEGEAGSLLVIDLESLIRMKHTQRAKDYAVIGELAARLPPEQEIQFTTDPDRLLTLASSYHGVIARAAIQAAIAGDRDGVVVALAREQDALQRIDRARVRAYAAAAEPYLADVGTMSSADRRLPGVHARLVERAERLLPVVVRAQENVDADVE
ncbi:MAG: hypothetical protein ABL961_16345 [Vicinamibacterales bacterium]